MTHEPVKLYAAAIIRDEKGRVLLTRHARSSKWHFPDCTPVVGESSWTALKRALPHDLGREVKLETQPDEVTEVINKGIRHVTLHYTAELEDGTTRPCEGLLCTWMDLTSAGDFYLSTKIVLDRLR